jgi:hypothetical protein
MQVGRPLYGNDGRDASSMRQGGYSAITTQSEVTKIEGAVDHAQLRRQLKNATNSRNIAKTYPNATASTLCIQPRQIVFGIKRHRQAYSMQSGGSGERVISALNGFHWGEYPSMDAMMRDLYPAGVSKTSIPLQGMPNGDYADQSGIAYLVSGSISIDRNSGPKRILPADMIMLVPPPPNQQNPNTNRVGVDPNRITLQTVPYDPCNHGIQLTGAHGAYSIPPESPVAPGIAGLPFYAAFETSNNPPDNPGLTNQQWMALSLRSADDAKAAAYIETLLAAGVLTINRGANLAQYAPDEAARTNAATQTAQLFAQLGAFADRKKDTAASPILEECRDQVYLNYIDDINTPIATVALFKQYHPAGFEQGNVNNMPVMLTEESTADEQYARLRWDGPALGVNGVLNAKYSVERWLVGRALSAAAPGDTLDIDWGRRGGTC